MTTAADAAGPILAPDHGKHKFVACVFDPAAERPRSAAGPPTNHEGCAAG
jgi:hypothetical protein